jgi:hypothetical protein
LQTLTEIAAENNSTTIFPIPIDLFKVFFQRADDAMAAPHPLTAPAALPVEGGAGALPASDPAEQLRQLLAAQRERKSE